MKLVCVGIESYLDYGVFEKGNFLLIVEVKKLKIRLVGVGMMRFFIKEIGVGEGSVLLYIK